MMEEVICGGSHTYYIKGYSEEIKIGKITYFYYKNGDFIVSCKLEGKKLYVESFGGNYRARDNSCFRLKYYTSKLKILDDLNKIIVNSKLYKNNGYYNHTDGIEDIYGDELTVEYDNNERIHKEDNQQRQLNEKDIKKIYNLFLDLARSNKYDFTTSGSNQIIYDDATNEYLQGKWKGKHFGDEINVSFENDIVYIYINNELVLKSKYIINKGMVINDKNEPFCGYIKFSKKNDILLCAYFLNNSYSTCDLLKESK